MGYENYNVDKLNKLDETLNDFLDKGYIKMVELNREGEVMYETTEKGKEYFEEFERSAREGK